MLAVRNQLIKIALLAVYWVLLEWMQNYFGYSSVSNNLYSINQLKDTRWSNGLTRFRKKIFKPLGISLREEGKATIFIMVMFMNFH